MRSDSKEYGLATLINNEEASAILFIFLNVTLNWRNTFVKVNYVTFCKLFPPHTAKFSFDVFISIFAKLFLELAPVARGRGCIAAMSPGKLPP